MRVKKEPRSMIRFLYLMSGMVIEQLFVKVTLKCARHATRRLDCMSFMQSHSVSCLQN